MRNAVVLENDRPFDLAKDPAKTGRGPSTDSEVHVRVVLDHVAGPVDPFDDRASRGAVLLVVWPPGAWPVRDDEQFAGTRICDRLQHLLRCDRTVENQEGDGRVHVSARVQPAVQCLHLYAAAASSATDAGSTYCVVHLNIGRITPGMCPVQSPLAESPSRLSATWNATALRHWY